MSKTFLTNRLLLTAKHTCWMLHIIIFHSQFVVQYSNKCLASLPKCVNKCLALLSKIFCRFFTNACFTSTDRCSKCFALHPKYSRRKRLKPKIFGKKLNRSLVLHPKSLNKRVDSYPRWWDQWLALQMPSFTFRLFEQSLLCIQNVRTNPFASYPRILKQFRFWTKVFEQMPWFASKMWANNFLRI